MSTPLLVTPPNIETQLSKFWDGLEGSNKIRACLFNLIIFTTGDKRSDYLHAVTKRVIEKFPSRVIYITKHEKQLEEMQTKVSVISPNKDQPDVACDFIEIDIPQSQENKVPFLILPHILPDLPVYVLWTEDPLLENPIAIQLEKLATRMIFDSEATKNLHQFALNILHRKNQFSCDIADLNWARIESWRNLLSAAFHSLDKFTQLKNAKAISIVYNNFETPFLCNTKTPALYLQGWIASQMGWKCKKVDLQGQNQVLTYLGSDKDITVTLEPKSYSQMPSGNVLSCKITTYNNEQFYFERSLTHPQQITISISSQEKCELPSQYLFTKSESGHSLVKEISHSGTSSHYMNLLQLISSSEYKNLC
ncbi:MAG: hypothetical protein HKM07_06725 [Chlamydiae bacterium]|nr:hypothetical protein [Chlamydiota bacterium]